MRERFNSDLLVEAADRAYGREAYGDLFHALYNEPLVEAFQHYDAIANSAAARRRRLGWLSVALAFLALTLITARLLLEALEQHPARTLVYASETCLLMSLLLPPLVLAPLRRRWLEARLMTERLRQWHFEWILSAGGALEATCEASASGELTPLPEAVARYEEARHRALDRFLRQMSKLALRLDSALAGRTFERQAPVRPFPPGSRVLPRLFEAYDELRFAHQLDYAAGKLAHTAKGSLRRRHHLLRVSSTIALAFAVALCAAVLALHAVRDLGWLDLRWVDNPWWPALAICAAVASVAIRALETGLGLPSALARYESYAATVESLRDRFHRASRPSHKLAIMRKMEEAATREMMLFLSQQNATTFGL